MFVKMAFHILGCLILCVLMARPSFATSGNGVDLVELGLNTATAMASEKDVVKGLKTAAKDEYTDWFWQSLGGTEKFMTNNAEAEIPAAKDKIMLVVSTVQAIEKFAIAMTEGKYDDAAFAAIDQVVSVVNHPLVSVTWSMAKLTYESHKAVVSSKAALQVETIYGIVANDRRMMGVIDPKADQPALIPVDKEHVEYFFNKYVITGGGARAAVRAYVETVLNEEWPEESWGDYMKSWMAVGSGVDTAKNAETEMLATEWRNKARGWTRQLLEEANKQAKTAWAQARLRQQMAEFKRFSDSVGHFYNGDFERMLAEFAAIKRVQKEVVEYPKYLEASKKQRAEVEAKASALKDKDVVSANNLLKMADPWYYQCLTYSTRADMAGEKGLASSFMQERALWKAVTDKLGAFIDSKKEQVVSAVETEMVDNFARYDDQHTKARAAYAEKYFNQLQEEYLKDFEWDFDVPDVETSDGGTIAVSSDAEDVQKLILEECNKGNIGLGALIYKTWKEAGMAHLQEWAQPLQTLVKGLPVPEEISVKKAEAMKMREQAKVQTKPVDAQINALIGQSMALRKKAYYAKTTAEEKSLEAQADSLGVQIQSLRKQVNAVWSPVYAMDREAQYMLDGWSHAISNASKAAQGVLAAADFVYNENIAKPAGITEAFSALRDARAKQYAQYKDQCTMILKQLPAPLPVEDNYWLMADEIRQVNEGSYTYMKAPAVKGAVKAKDMVSFLSSMAPDMSNQFLSERLLSGAAELESRSEVWQKAEEEFLKLEPLPLEDIRQITVLVGRDSGSDIEKCLKDIKKAIEYANVLRAAIPKIKAAAKKAATDSLNREKDSDFVIENVNVINAYFQGLQDQGLIRRGSDDYEIVLPHTGREGMVIVEEPFAHYAMSHELKKLGQPLRDAWGRMKALSFAQTNASAYVAKWQEIMDLANVPAAKEENFIAPNNPLPIYKSDLKAAEGLLANLKGTSEKYAETMEKVAKLVPGLMQVPTIIDQEQDEKMAALYKMNLQEYREKFTKRSGPVINYLLTDEAKYMVQSPDPGHELGKMYVEIAKRVEKLRVERVDAEAALKTKEDLARAKAYEDEKRKKAEAESQAMLDKMQGTELAGYYGYGIEDARINSRSLRGAFGNVVLTRQDIPSGKIDLDVRLFTIDKMQTLLLSDDGGRTWREVPLARSFQASFEPLPGKMYDFLLRIKTTDQREVVMKVFSGVNGINYEDVDFTQLVAETVKNIADAYERQDIMSFSDQISRDYLGNKAILEEGARFDFDLFSSIRLKIYINRIVQQGTMFIAETKWDKSQNPRTTGQEQRTSGQTTFMFVLEDGKMKIRNLRGDLIYATLSPQIAQASGKSATVVDDIRTAQEERNPEQPGAGETEDAGGVTSSSGGSSPPPVAASITVTSPNGGEMWTRGSTYAVTWNSTGVSDVMIEYSEGGFWYPIVASTVASVGTYSWTIDPMISPVAASNVRITAVEDGSVSDTSNSSFSIL